MTQRAKTESERYDEEIKAARESAKRATNHTFSAMCCAESIWGRGTPQALTARHVHGLAEAFAGFLQLIGTKK